MQLVGDITTNAQTHTISYNMPYTAPIFVFSASNVRLAC